MFAAREVPSESLGFSPFELVYGHEVRSPLKVCCLMPEEQDESVHMLKYVSDFKSRLNEACRTAKENLGTAQSKMKTWYDKRAREQQFSTGDEVLLLLPIPGSPLQAKFTGPYTVVKRLNSVDYLISTPDRRKTKRVCHVNMIKPYHERGVLKPVGCMAPVGVREG